MGVSEKLYEAAGSVSEWAYGSSTYPSGTSDNNKGASSTNPSSSSDSYWTYASSSFQNAVDSTNAAASSLYESLYSPTSANMPTAGNDQMGEPALAAAAAKAPRTTNRNFIGWKLSNPYSNIRGREYQPSSLSAVRSLLRVVPVKQEGETVPTLERAASDTAVSLDESVSSFEQNKQPFLSRNETASQLAEGTIRALRDLELDEAMELHTSLQYWTLRWERPLLSWIEAGPWVWFSEEGYNHNLIGQRVSQIQAVLARRCAAIGELQQHLLRAGWQKGVAQWGVLGQGGQWANVAGADGAINEEPSKKVMADPRSRRFSTQACLEQLPLPESSFTSDQHHLPRDPNAELYYGHSNVLVRKTIGGSVVVNDAALAAWAVDAIWVVRDQLYRASIGLVHLPSAENWRNDAEIGELISEGVENGSTQLPTWAARQQYRPTESKSDTEIETIMEEEDRDVEVGDEQVLERVAPDEIIAKAEEKAAEKKEEGGVVITDLNAMALEVSELLNSMEVVIEIQRNRRLEKLRGLPLIRRNWYMAALGAPMTAYLVYWLLKDGHGKKLARIAIEKISSFFNEHVYEPVSAILSEFFSRRDRDTIIDHKARLDAIESLKKMIESWLEETFSDTFSEDEIHKRAESMDMSLIEQKKEENMKTIYEINSVVRMSLIEMQFIKKELLNALYAIDEMMTSNEINMNLASVTPAVLLLLFVNKSFRFLFYALLRVRKSREETFSSFRHIILDMDRLLLMRDNPPSAPPPLTWTENGEPAMVVASRPEEPRGPCVLNADDLGMLMLHIHECRTILWEDRRRFSLKTLRDVNEDLAELAGERGPVSVEQQLQIISRMCRTYPFLKVASQGAG